MEVWRCPHYLRNAGSSRGVNRCTHSTSENSLQCGAPSPSHHLPVTGAPGGQHPINGISSLDNTGRAQPSEGHPGPLGSSCPKANDTAPSGGQTHPTAAEERQLHETRQGRGLLGWQDPHSHPRRPRETAPPPLGPVWKGLGGGTGHAANWVCTHSSPRPAWGTQLHKETISGMGLRWAIRSQRRTSSPLCKPVHCPGLSPLKPR